MADFLYKIIEALGFPHAVHPLLVHLTVGSVTVTLVFYLIAWIFKKPVLYSSAKHTVIFAFYSSLLTTFMGFMDWFYYRSGVSTDTITIKIVMSGVLIAVLLATLLVNRRVRSDSRLSFALYVASFAAILVLGFFGGELVSYF